MEDYGEEKNGKVEKDCEGSVAWCLRCWNWLVGVASFSAFNSVFDFAFILPSLPVVCGRLPHSWSKLTHSAFTFRFWLKGTAKKKNHLAPHISPSWQCPFSPAM